MHNHVLNDMLYEYGGSTSFLAGSACQIMMGDLHALDLILMYI